jgi:hypothetical protein
MLFDPKGPLGATPECMANQPSNGSLFGSFSAIPFSCYILYSLCICLLIHSAGSSNWTGHVIYSHTSQVLIVLAVYQGST